ncbi:remorin-like [Rhododendron vialii]|uniref:remorin-like n=1 Tax=Rhododendron vialii TaxID=182163 RepID=UPI00265E139D|nr:remorin-like [Rhododendron vialii]
MGAKKVEFETTPVVVASAPSKEKEAPAVEKLSDEPQEKSLVLITDEKVLNSKTLAVVAKVSDPAAEKKKDPPAEKKPIDRDTALARVETEKRMALIKAWEESEKTKADNKAYKKLSAIGAWENSKKACVDAQLKKIEENIEKKKAQYAEKMNNKAAEIHKAAEEKRAMVEAQRGEVVFKVEEAASKFRSSGTTPKRFFGCFSC